MLTDRPSATIIVDDVSGWLTGRTSAAVIDGRHNAACTSDAGLALDQPRRLDDIEDFVLMNVDVLLEPAASA